MHDTKQDTKATHTDRESLELEYFLGQCLVEGAMDATSGGSRIRRGRIFGLALILEAAMLAVLLVLPLLTTVAQPSLRGFTLPMTMNLVGWRSHIPSPIPDSASGPARREGPFERWDFRPPRPDQTSISHQGPGPEDSIAIGQDADLVSGAIDLAGLGATPPIGPTPPAVRQSPAKISPETRTVKMSEGLQQAQLISRIEPQYPYLARATRTEGTVILHAVISRDGRITALELLSGPALLVQSAIDAVRQWRYRPTLLNGEAVEVDTTITVIFRLEVV